MQTYAVRKISCSIEKNKLTVLHRPEQSENEWGLKQGQWPCLHSAKILLDHEKLPDQPLIQYR